MNIKALFLTTIVGGFVFSCTNTNSVTETPVKEQEVVYWVNSSTQPCGDNAENQCLQIQNNDTIDYGMWREFDAKIEGFEFKPGYLTQIKVNKVKNNTAEGADALTYTLVKVLDQKLDPRYQEHEIWAVESIDGENWGFNSEVHEKAGTARFELNVSEMKVLGTDGCNQIQ